MEFLLFLNSNERIILDILKEANYKFEENTPLCLIGKNYFGFHKKKSKTIVICTENAKSYGGYNLPRARKRNENYKTGMYIRKALRHEAVHAAQSCNNDKPIELKGKKKFRLNDNKKNAYAGSINFSGNERREYEAYSIEDQPRVVIELLNRYCL